MYRRRTRRLKLALTSWSIAGALLAVAPCLRAQETVPAAAAQQRADAPAGAVRVVVIAGDDDLQFAIGEPGKRFLFTCDHRCTFWALPGRYSLLVTTADQEIDEQGTLQVGPHAVFAVSVGHNAVMRTTGLIAGIAGPIAMVSSVVLFVNFALDHPCGDPDRKNECPTDSVSGRVFLAGLASTVIGWAVFGLAPHELHVDAVDKADVETKPSRPVPLSQQEHSLRPKLGVIGFPQGGVGVGLSVVF